MADDAVAARVAAVRAAVAEAARGVGRDPAAVRIIAVSKTVAPPAVTALLATGLGELGENYVREARGKRDAVRAPAVWHLIGGLQRNKVRAAVGVFDWVHTVDSEALAASLAAEARRVGRRLPVLIQVNLAGEARKRGVPPEAAERLAAAVLPHAALRLEGLMTVPPEAADPAATRPHFRALRDLRDTCAIRLGVELPHLSMGMSADFRVAVEEGATMLRLGRALFGARLT